MQRREFITVFGGTAAMWPVAARAQQSAGRVYRIGYLSLGPGERAFSIKAFEDGLPSLGYRDGENLRYRVPFREW